MKIFIFLILTVSGIDFNQFLNIDDFMSSYEATSEWNQTELSLTDWQTVEGTNYKFSVYSAYYDNRQGRIIRIIAAAHSLKPCNVSCLLTYPNMKTLVIQAIKKRLNENHGKNYSAYFIICPLESRDIPTFVSVVANGTVGNRLKIFNLPKSTKSAEVKNLAICVPPLYDFEFGLELLEFIEFNRMMGVEHFVFYNQSVSRVITCIMNEYIKQGLVTVLPWKMNMKSNSEIIAEGIMASLNDCLYRFMYK